MDGLPQSTKESLKRLADLGKKSPLIETFRYPPMPPIHHIDPQKGYRAEDYHDRLKTMIQEFEAELDDEHEVGARLVNFGQTVQFHLQDIGYFNPSMIRFFGETDSGEPIELIQHISQISIMLIRMKRLDPDKPKTRFGFNQDE